jgi:hypothetical protein
MNNSDDYSQTIDLFMKIEREDKFIASNFQYKDWGALMPVVCKIESIENGRFGFTVDPWSIVIIDYLECDDEGLMEPEIINIIRDREAGDTHDVLLSDYYYAVSKFIEWYKTNKTPAI